jgi:hypothetical protein
MEKSLGDRLDTFPHNGRYGAENALNGIKFQAAKISVSEISETTDGRKSKVRAGLAQSA